MNPHITSRVRHADDSIARAPTSLRVDARDRDGVVACAVRTKMTFAGVVGALEVALDQSVRRASGGLRQACSRESTESKPYGIAATCLRQLEAVVEALANSNGDDVVARDRARMVQ